MSCQNAIMRLSEYRHILCKLRALGFVKVFSDHLAGALDVSPALVRKDFSDFGLTGNRKSGYAVDDLIGKLNAILCKDRVEKVVVVGCGGVGRAMMGYNVFAGEAIRVVAGFDSNPELQNPDAVVPVYDISRVADYVREHGIRTAIMAVPESSAGDMAECLAEAGVSGILNFSPITLKSSDICFIKNINFLYELENTIYFSAKIENNI